MKSQVLPDVDWTTDGVLNFLEKYLLGIQHQLDVACEAVKAGIKDSNQLRNELKSEREARERAESALGEARALMIKAQAHSNPGIIMRLHSEALKVLEAALKSK